MNNLELFIRSDLAMGGYDEDGSPIINEHFYIVAEDRNGYRWAHAPAVQDVELAEAALEVLEEVGVDMEDGLWASIEPRYGSRAYQVEEPYIVAREREDERGSFA